MPESDYKKYQTVQHNRVKQYPQEHKDKFLSAAFRICTLKKKSFNLTFLYYVRKNSCTRI